MEYSLNSPYDKHSFTTDFERRKRATFDSILFLVKKKAYAPKKQRYKPDTRAFIQKGTV